MFIRRKKKMKAPRVYNWRGDRKLPGYLRQAGEFYRNHRELCMGAAR